MQKITTALSISKISNFTQTHLNIHKCQFNTLINKLSFKPSMVIEHFTNISDFSTFYLIYCKVNDNKSFKTIAGIKLLNSKINYYVKIETRYDCI